MCVDVMQKFDRCRHCGERLPDILSARARRQLQQGIHSGCEEAELKIRHACCDKAERKPCVCFIAYTCAEHGERHIGTHD